MKNEFILPLALSVVIGVCSILAMVHNTTPYQPEPTTRNVDVIIGSLCNAGPEIVTNRWDDPALDGCKETRVHNVTSEF